MTKELTKELKAFEILSQHKDFIQQLKADKMLKVTFNTLYNYVKNGNCLLDLPWFDLMKKQTSLKSAN